MDEQTPHHPVEASPNDQKRHLALAVQREVTAGYRVESQTDINAILVKGGKINHLLHLILTFFTCGVWALVWVALYAINREQRLILSVDDYGNVLRQTA
jgi:hypothetical protein